MWSKTSRLVSSLVLCVLRRMRAFFWQVEKASGHRVVMAISMAAHTVFQIVVLQKVRGADLLSFPGAQSIEQAMNISYCIISAIL